MLQNVLITLPKPVVDSSKIRGELPTAGLVAYGFTRPTPRCSMRKSPMLCTATTHRSTSIVCKRCTGYACCRHSMRHCILASTQTSTSSEYRRTALRTVAACACSSSRHATVELPETHHVAYGTFERRRLPHTDAGSAQFSRAHHPVGSEAEHGIPDFGCLILVRKRGFVLA